MLRVIRILIGVVLILFGSLGVLVSIIAIVDPVGTKMADDNDPFGPSPSRVNSALMTAAFAGVAVGGGFLVAWNTKRKSGVEQGGGEESPTRRD